MQTIQANDLKKSQRGEVPLRVWLSPHPSFEKAEGRKRRNEFKALVPIKIYDLKKSRMTDAIL